MYHLFLVAFDHRHRSMTFNSQYACSKVTVIRNDCGEKMMRDAARKACIALDCSDENDPDRKQDMATSLKVKVNSSLLLGVPILLSFFTRMRAPLYRRASTGITKAPGTS